MLKEYSEAVAAVFAVQDSAFLYLVDEYSGLPVLGLDDDETYQHVFRDGVTDI